MEPVLVNPARDRFLKSFADASHGMWRLSDALDTMDRAYSARLLGLPVADRHRYAELVGEGFPRFDAIDVVNLERRGTWLSTWRARRLIRQVRKHLASVRE